MNENNIAVNDDSKGKLYIYGTRGYSAYEIAIRNGFVGTEEEWLKSLVGPIGEQGVEGKSAYEVAVENGYTGTEGQWVNDFLTPDGYYNKNEIDSLESVQNNKIIKKPYYFNNVAEMKAYNLKDGDCVITLGYYEANDGGGSLYKITDTQNSNIIQIDLENGLYANLIYNDKINIKQLGILPDVDYTELFNKLCSIPKINIIIPEGNYIIKYFTLSNNVNLIGIGKPIINIDIDNNGGIMSSIGSNCNITNINFKSLSDDKYGSRIDINEQNNIVIENCKFEHFLYLTNIYAMGLLIRKSNNITIKNCIFTNNDQDIAISHGDCSNIYIKDCIMDNFLNFEIETGILNNCYVDNCKINNLALFGYDAKQYLIKDTTISNCTINNISFKGAKFKLLNNKILDFSARAWLTESASSVENINSMYFGEQLNNDPNFYCFGAKSNIGLFNVARDNFEEQYIPNSITGVVEDGVRFISLNEGLSSQIVSIQKTFKVTSLNKYLIRTKMKVKHGDSGSYSAGNHCLYITFYDVNNEQVEDRIQVSIDKFETANSESEFSEKWIPLAIPETAEYIRVEFFNTRRNSSGKANSLWNTFKLNQISQVNLYNEIEDNKSKLSTPPSNDAIAKMRNVRMKGDTIYNTDYDTNNVEKWINIKDSNTSPYTADYKAISLD